MDEEAGGNNSGGPQCTRTNFYIGLGPSKEPWQITCLDPVPSPAGAAFRSAEAELDGKTTSSLRNAYCVTVLYGLSIHGGTNARTWWSGVVGREIPEREA